MSTCSQKWNDHVAELVEEGYDAQEAVLEAMRRWPADYVKTMQATGMSSGAIVSRMSGIGPSRPPTKARTKA